MKYSEFSLGKYCNCILVFVLDVVSVYNFILRRKKKQNPWLSLDLGSISCLLIPAAFTSEPLVKCLRTTTKSTAPTLIRSWHQRCP